MCMVIEQRLLVAKQQKRSNVNVCLMLYITSDNFLEHKIVEAKCSGHIYIHYTVKLKFLNLSTVYFYVFIESNLFVSN